MDDITETIVDFALALSFDDIPDLVRGAAEIRIVDTIGCALAALAEPIVQAGAALVPLGPMTSGPTGAVIGQSATSCPVDHAAFLNTCMIRSLDFNDWSPNGHPSDCLGGLLAVADLVKPSGAELVGAAGIAYETFMRLMDVTRLPYLGWDHGFAMGVATTAALGRLLDLSRTQLGHALGIVASSGVPTKATRSGELSMWKGCATAFAVRNAVFATQLARAGVTGPSRAFEGRYGICDLITGPFTLDLPAQWNLDMCVTRSSLKQWPLCYYSQAPAEAALALHRVLGSCDQLDSIEVISHAEVLQVTADDARKWDPQTRETADHSTPYIVAKLLRDGVLDDAIFSPEAYLDPSLRPLMAKVRVTTGEAASAAFPQAIMTTLIARDVHGTEHRADAVNPRGHPDNPMAVGELRQKFTRLVASAVADADSIAWLFETWYGIGGQADVGAALQQLTEVLR